MLTSGGLRCTPRCVTFPEMRDAEEIKVARWCAGLTNKSLEVKLLSDLQYLNHEQSAVSLMLLTLWKQPGVC